MNRLRCGALLALALVASWPAGPGSMAHADEIAERGPVTNLPLPRFVSIRAEHANARRGPGLDYRIDWEFVRRGLPVEVTAEYGQWRRVRDADGLGGWVHQSLLSGVRMGIVEGSEPVVVRERPEDDAAVRARAEPGALVGVDACEGVWCRINSGGFEGWLPRAALWGVHAQEEFD